MIDEWDDRPVDVDQAALVRDGLLPAMHRVLDQLAARADSTAVRDELQSLVAARLAVPLY